MKSPLYFNSSMRSVSADDVALAHVVSLER